MKKIGVFSGFFKKGFGAFSGRNSFQRLSGLAWEGKFLFNRFEGGGPKGSWVGITWGGRVCDMSERCHICDRPKTKAKARDNCA